MAHYWEFEENLHAIAGRRTSVFSVFRAADSEYELNRRETVGVRRRYGKV